ncbi:hypothetical protein DFA_04610 [Cavenderia fasciculata]|uniref:Uncharacterized protein n=1 Tax=Cavenderia fasciculata TaxID=261658 RepID=F4PQ19_CACFS|nr:uncharacterized protein DFA_04610 [Cavenderia fasciculata]EGG22482.1 hypothetical protein DFA_04610 [Cavenderia fasciculata]|eukprot:XP_004360333.1 hypothetical protein DFA_04610 [Cavenderia fasciculata]
MEIFRNKYLVEKIFRHVKEIGKQLYLVNVPSHRYVSHVLSNRRPLIKYIDWKSMSEICKAGYHGLVLDRLKMGTHLDLLDFGTTIAVRDFFSTIGLNCLAIYILDQLYILRPLWFTLLNDTILQSICKSGSNLHVVKHVFETYHQPYIERLILQEEEEESNNNNNNNKKKNTKDKKKKSSSSGSMIEQQKPVQELQSDLVASAVLGNQPDVVEYLVVEKGINPSCLSTIVGNAMTLLSPKSIEEDCGSSSLSSKDDPFKMYNTINKIFGQQAVTDIINTPNHFTVINLKIPELLTKRYEKRIAFNNVIQSITWMDFPTIHQFLLHFLQFYFDQQERNIILNFLINHNNNIDNNIDNNNDNSNQLKIEEIIYNIIIILKLTCNNIFRQEALRFIISFVERCLKVDKSVKLIPFYLSMATVDNVVNIATGQLNIPTIDNPQLIDTTNNPLFQLVPGVLVTIFTYGTTEQALSTLERCVVTNTYIGPVALLAAFSRKDIDVVSAILKYDGQYTILGPTPKTASPRTLEMMQLVYKTYKTLKWVRPNNDWTVDMYKMALDMYEVNQDPEDSLQLVIGIVLTENDQLFDQMLGVFKTLPDCLTDWIYTSGRPSRFFDKLMDRGELVRSHAIIFAVAKSGDLETYERLKKDRFAFQNYLNIGIFNSTCARDALAEGQIDLFAHILSTRNTPDIAEYSHYCNNVKAWNYYQTNFTNDFKPMIHSIMINTIKQGSPEILDYLIQLDPKTNLQILNKILKKKGLVNLDLVGRLMKHHLSTKNF